MTVKSELKRFMEARKVEKVDLDALTKLAVEAVGAFAKNMKSAGSMKGGRVLLPAEYFGVETNHYVNEAVAPSVAETAEMIRPSIEQTFPDTMEGGAMRHFHVPQMVMKSAFGKSDVKREKKIFDAMFTKVLMKVTAPKAAKKEVTVEMVRKVLSQKQFSLLH